MTALLEAAPELVIVEERQPSAPRTCSRGHHPGDDNPPCQQAPEWEALCMGCGHVFLRCEEHYIEHYMTSKMSEFVYGSDATGQCHVCVRCGTKVYIEQYGRL